MVLYLAVILELWLLKWRDFATLSVGRAMSWEFPMVRVKKDCLEADSENKIGL